MEDEDPARIVQVVHWRHRAVHEGVRVVEVEKLIDGLQFFPGLEADSLSGRDIHFSAGAWIASDAGLAGADVEDSEAAQLDAVASRQGLLHAFKHGLNGGFRL